MPILEHPSNLHPVREEDLDFSAKLMGNPDLMRFSLGVLAQK